MTRFEKVFLESKLILTEGALVERLKSEFNLEMNQHLNHAGLIYDNPEPLEILYRQYIDIAVQHSLPIMIMTPTRRVNSESLARSVHRIKNVLSDSADFLHDIRASYSNHSQNIMNGGLLGCKGDAYSGEKILDANAAYDFHRMQTKQFESTKVDFLFAGIMPEINEALGMARAMAETNIPFIISFMLHKNGCLLDGTLLADAIKTIDEQIAPKPICYMTNCIHPTNLKQAFFNEKNHTRTELKRFSGVQANASILSPEELNNCSVLHQDDFDNLVDEMRVLKEQFGLKIIGGCCGTDEQLIADLANKLKT
ncbi:MAG: homocysteine S-methyltransferase family protein [Calditrichia bacterium]